jgi:membrane-associated phospholipid phosphatase
VDLPTHAAVAGGLLALSAAAVRASDQLAPPHCRWCEPDALDRWARRELRWRHPGQAAQLSDVLVLAVPAGAAVALGLSAHDRGGTWRQPVEDLVVVSEAVAVATALTQAAKFSAARLRPDAWASGGGGSSTSRMSFWGGHSAFAFSVAAGTTEVLRRRGWTGWGWAAAATFTGAAATSWLRVGADRHWLTDVVVGAGVGTASGLLVPGLVLRPAGASTGDGAGVVTLVPAPGGFALLF